MDESGRYHRKDGKFASYKEIHKELDIPEFVYSKRYFEGYAIKEEKKKIKHKFKQKGRIGTVPERAGKYVTRDYAYMFKCVCRVREYRVNINGEHIYYGNDYIIIEHFVALSTNSNNNTVVINKMAKHHKRHWKEHELEELELLSVRIGEQI